MAVSCAEYGAMVCRSAAYGATVCSAGAILAGLLYVASLANSTGLAWITLSSGANFTAFASCVASVFAVASTEGGIFCAVARTFGGIDCAVATTVGCAVANAMSLAYVVA